MRTRLKDIAQDLNISPGLVSGVLNGRENVWASEETRRKIFESAKRLNYIPNLPTKTRPQALTGRIELVFCRESGQPSSELASIVESLSAEAELHRLVFVVSGMTDVRLAVEYLESQPSTRSDPVVLWGTRSELELMGRVLTRREIPFLACGETDGLDSSWAQGSINFEGMIRGAVDHVRVQGHRSIAFIGVANGSHRFEIMQSTFRIWSHSCLGSAVPERFIVSCSNLADCTREISSLLELPVGERPTGFVVGGGEVGWIALEMSLFAIGEKLGFGASQVSAAGIVDKPFHLVFGDALGFDLTDSAVFTASTRPLISELARNGVCRGANILTPRLSRIPSLHLPLQPDSSDSKVLL